MPWQYHVCFSYIDTNFEITALKGRFSLLQTMAQQQFLSLIITGMGM